MGVKASFQIHLNSQNCQSGPGVGTQSPLRTSPSDKWQSAEIERSIQEPSYKSHSKIFLSRLTSICHLSPLQTATMVSSRAHCNTPGSDISLKFWSMRLRSAVRQISTRPCAIWWHASPVPAVMAAAASIIIRIILEMMVFLPSMSLLVFMDAVGIKG